MVYVYDCCISGSNSLAFKQLYNKTYAVSLAFSNSESYNIYGMYHFVTYISTGIESFLATDNSLLFNMHYEFDTEHTVTFKFYVTLGNNMLRRKSLVSTDTMCNDFVSLNIDKNPTQH